MEANQLLSDHTRLRTAVTEDAGVSIIKLAGEVDVYTAPDFKDAINKVITDGAKYLVIDLAEVSYMDSSGFGALLSATKRVKPEGGTVNLVYCNEAVERMLRITRLDSIFGLFNDMSCALNAAKLK